MLIMRHSTSAIMSYASTIMLYWYKMFIYIALLFYADIKVSVFILFLLHWSDGIVFQVKYLDVN